MIGQVSVNNVNRAQGGFAGVEQKFLFIGAPSSAGNNDQVLALNSESDLDALLGSNDSELKTQLIAARVNAGANWMAWAVPTANAWETALALALEQPHSLEPEAVVVCTPITTTEEVTAAYAAMELARTQHALFMAVHLCVSGIAILETWSDYSARIKPIISGVAGYRVSVTPLLHGNDLGVVCGRLCNTAVSVADSPMRVRTGPLVGLGAAPVDTNNAPLTMAHISDLAAARFSVPQWYTGYAGIYWADMAMLDNPAGDFQVYENLRVLDYLARRVRVLALAKIADRSLNTTAKSMAFHNAYFMRPLRESSKGVVIGGEPFPAMIKPPVDGDIVISWKTRTEVEIYIQAAPYECPKKISVFMMLDLNRGLEAA